MTHRPLLALAAALLLSACGSEQPSTPAGLVVTLDQAAIPADGASTVRVTVTGDVVYPLVLTTTGGSWWLPYPGGPKDRSVKLDSINQWDLVTCDYKVDAGCTTGTVEIRAADARLASGRASVRFTTY